MPPPDDRILDLLSAYQHARDHGQELTPEQLAPDDASMWKGLGDAIAAIQRLSATAPAPTVPWPPDRVGTFKLGAELGRGGMGCVFEAKDEKLRRRVAVKLLRPELIARPGAAERFLREARAAAAVAHENVVPVHDVGDQDGIPYIVMPLLRGEALDRRLARSPGPLPAVVVLKIGRDAAAGLAAAHARGLVHRDIKPANLWLDEPSGRVLVLDFGLARITEDQVSWSSISLTDGGLLVANPNETGLTTTPGALIGSPRYMAPEQAERMLADARSDLFSLGAVLYEAATGKPAFPGDTMMTVLRQVSEYHPPPPRKANPRTPRGLSDLIMRLLAKSPADRPGSAAAVAQELDRLSGGTGETSSLFAVTHAPPAGPRAGVVVGLLAGLGVIAAVALWAAFGR